MCVIWRIILEIKMQKKNYYFFFVNLNVSLSGVVRVTAVYTPTHLLYCDV